MPLQPQHFTWSLAATTLLTLAACGGGGGGDGAAPATNTTFSGTAATGKAMANAAVTITCAAGAGSTTTSATGTYSTSIASVTLPCALKAAGTDGTVLYSVTTATPTGPNTQTANITPLTQLMVASLSGAEPASFFANFNAANAATVTATNLAAAQAAVLSLLTQAGVSTTGVTDPIAGTLTAGSGSGYDGVLDQLQAQLATGGATLAALTTTVAATAPAAVASGAASTDHTPRLPANLLLRDAAANCPALRSGDYVAISPQLGVSLADQISFPSFDAKTLTFSNPANAGGGGTLVADGPCGYTVDGDIYAVSKAGVLLGTNTEAGKKGLSVIFPRQTIAVAELAGTWNGIGLEDAAADRPLDAFTITVSPTGAVSDIVVCDEAGATNASSCHPEMATLNVASDSAGNLSITSTTPGDAWSHRLVAYRAGSGDLVVAELAPSGSFAFWTKKRTLALPTVGDVSPAGLSVRINPSFTVLNADKALPGATFAVDAAAKTITRTQTLISGATYNDMVTINQPRDGYNLRLPMSVVASDGSTQNLRGRTSLGVLGTGLSFQIFPAINSLQATIDR